MLDAFSNFFRSSGDVARPVNPAEGTRFGHLREGAFDPELGRWVRKVILVVEAEFAVYVDRDYDVQYLSDKTIDPAEFGKVQTQVLFLEQASQFLKRDRHALLHVRCLLAQAYAQVLETDSSDEAAEPLALARALLAQKSPDVSFAWYFESAAVTCILFALAALFLWGSRYRPCVTTYLGRTAFELILCIFAGGIGALFSISSRAAHLPLNALAGRRTHELEAHARLFAGSLSAALLVLALKSKLILAPLGQGAGHLSTLLLLSVLAGISERVVPSLVGRFEESLSKTEKELQERSVQKHPISAVKGKPRKGAEQATTMAPSPAMTAPSPTVADAAGDRNKSPASRTTDVCDDQPGTVDLKDN